MNIESILKNTGALLEGHFKLTSGLHSDKYIDKMQIIQDPFYTSWICKEMSKPFANEEIDIVVGPAMGGIVLAFEVGKTLNKKAFFAHRDKEGKLTFRKSFVIEPKMKILLVEDIITTGGSIQELITLIRQMGAVPVGLTYIVDRSNGRARFDIPAYPLMKMRVETYQPEECPLCKNRVPMSTLGSTGK